MTQYSGVFSLQQQGQALTSGQWATDPYFKNTTLLLHADGVAGGTQNNTFIDSSTNNYPITRNGNTTQGAFSPYGTYGSVYYGSGNYWQAAQSTNWDIINGDFTVEMFVYLTGYTNDSNQGVFLVGNFDGGGGYAAGWSFGLTYGATPTLGISYWNGGGGTGLGYTGKPVPLNQWVHVAATRSGSTIYFYINGVYVSSAVAPVVNPGNKLTSGAYTQNFSYPSYVYGYISNIRIVKGTALYSGTSSFTVPTAPLTSVTNTVFLGNQNNILVDNGPNAVAITNYNTSPQRFGIVAPKYQSTPAVTGGSAYFDGSGDYLVSPIAAIGTGDFTVEGWLYINALSGTSSEGGFLQTSTSSGGLSTSDYGVSSLAMARNNSYNQYTFIVGPTAIYRNTVGTLLNQWVHFAAVRSSGTVRLYFNGVLDSTPTSATTNITGTYLALGGYYNTSYLMNGLWSNFRITNVAVYSGNFTPPTAPVTTSGAASAASYPSTTNVNTSFAASSTLFLGNFTNAGIYDNTMMNNLETVSGAQVNTSVVKYGTGSMYFNGSSDYLVAPPSESTNFGTGDFTVEFWVKGNPSGTYVQTIGKLYNFADDGAWRIGTRYNSANYVYFARGNGSTFETYYAETNVNDGLWHHVAVTRLNGYLSIYVDGTLRKQGTMTGTCSVANSLYVGFNYRDGQYFSGYLDDIRITKGVARYTGNFIPPKVAFANQ